ncbi:hypothetical protein KQH49_07340 [Mycetohabitans sp. B5]|uniref:Contractile injection system tube protein N-terminal domain-containing protein n=1 Tax=Mycetohabitans endofungorum TaxID=417203 RepID=A0A2P5KAT8_9BURK|nr:MULTISPECIES: hypothetical protein [Mycetohabitans]MCG1054780.1 hypothetical protein [Mycetohabitans sp. B5]PPB83838.1 hypothetical protein B0O95_10519 [Mycetohabitans endofungorum]
MRADHALAKLRVEAYADRDAVTATHTLTTLYNPSSIHLSYEADYVSQASLTTTWPGDAYRQVQPGSLSLELMFNRWDQSDDVATAIQSLHRMCFGIEPDSQTGEPMFLRVVWGQMRWHGDGYFAGRARSLRVAYTQFDRSGQVLQASARLTLMADGGLKRQLAGKVRQALAHRVPGGDTLPLVAAQSGRSAAARDYLSLAYQNNLDSISVLAPHAALALGRDED